jgi:hypothetical protein
VTFFPNFRREWRVNAVFRTAGTDLSGTKQYRYNAHGFRGEERNPEAAKRLYVFGCSITFGVGLSEDEIWASHFRDRYAERCGLVRSQVNLMNFGLGGASCREIARNVMLQCSVEKPDLAVVQFTFQDRDELIVEDHVIPLGSWLCTDTRAPESLRRLAINHYEVYREEQAAMNTVRSLLEAQHMCKANAIDYLLVCLVKPKNMSRPIQVLFDMLDRDRICWLDDYLALRAEDPVRRADVAADGAHYGPNSHKEMAELIWQHYAAMDTTPTASQ